MRFIMFSTFQFHWGDKAGGPSTSRSTSGMGAVRWKSVTGRRPTTSPFIFWCCLAVCLLSISVCAAMYNLFYSSSLFLLLSTMFFALHVNFAAIYNGFRCSAQFLLLIKNLFHCITLHVHFGCCWQCFPLLFTLLLSVYSHGGFSK
jgi:hypothetical protein